MFAIRAALAATLAPTWGVYSGFELFEGEAGQARQRGVPELGEVRAAPARLRGRRGRPAARWSPTSPGSTRSAARTRRCSSCATSQFHHIDNDAIICLLQDRPGHRRHRARGDHPRPVRTRRRAPPRSTCPRSGSTGATASRCTTRSPAGPGSGASTTTCGWSPGTTWRTSSASCADPLTEAASSIRRGGFFVRPAALSSPARGGGPNSVIDQVREALGAASTDRSTATDPTGTA